MMKKGIAVLLAASLFTAAFLTGCGDNKKNEVSENDLINARMASEEVRLEAPELEKDACWDGTAGEKEFTEGWTCGKALIPFYAEEDTIFVSDCEKSVSIVCYNEKQEVIPSSAVAPIPVIEGTHPVAVPAGTYFVGLNANSTEVTRLAIRRLTAAEIIENPYQTGEYIANCICNADGTFTKRTPDQGCVLFAVKPGDQYYTNVADASNFICFDAAGTYLGPGAAEPVAKHGMVFTIPLSSAYCYFNFPYQSDYERYDAVAYKITQKERILCIGETLTDLDGMEANFDSASLFMGYQKVLSRAGYRVESAAISGSTYAVDGTHNSIYTRIIDGSVDVSGYDIIILAGGQLDAYWRIPIGTVPTDYTDAEYDRTTMIGALGTIIRYIRMNNDSCKIILCTPLKAESPHLPYAVEVQYADAIREMAKYASCYLVDAFQNFNVQPFTNGFRKYFFDSANPNKYGMFKYGEMLLKAVEDVR